MGGLCGKGCMVPGGVGWGELRYGGARWVGEGQFMQDVKFQNRDGQIHTQTRRHHLRFLI